MFTFFKNNTLTELKRNQSINSFGMSIFEISGRLEYPSSITMVEDIYKLYQDDKYKEILSDPNLSKAIHFLNAIRNTYSYPNLLHKNILGLQEVDLSYMNDAYKTMFIDIMQSLVLYIYSDDSNDLLRTYLNTFGYDLLTYGPYDAVVLVIPYFLNGDRGLLELSYLVIPNPYTDIS